MTGDEECTKDIYNNIRRYAFWVLLVLLVGLVLVDVCDDLFLGNRYAGPPMWLVSIIGGCLATLFGARVIDSIKK